ncbi:MAG TPA: redoxin domain-containing protein [Fimbriimonadaceae bacterium]|nr:redoxin domain-containing protein [Fimbriimonadaceae bacterium]
MRFAAILVPLGVSLAVAGGIMYYASIKPAEAATPVPEIRHPVSRAMLLDAATFSEKVAPYFRLQDAHGIDVQIGGVGKKPQFVYFILDGCPCSLDAQPLFNKMYQRYKDKVDFIGVIDKPKPNAIDYAGMTTMLCPIVSDPDLKIVKAFKARESTYNVLIRPDGTIEKMWPGYCQNTMAELNRRLAKLTGEKEVAFDASLAPKEMKSGCFFY